MSTAAEDVRIDEGPIAATLESGRRHDAVQVREILARALELEGLPDVDLAVLMGVSDPELLGEFFQTARSVKETIYGNRLVLFAPLYISNLCANECIYCAFRAREPRARAAGAHPGRDRPRGAGTSSSRATSACCSSPASLTRARGSSTSSSAIDTIYRTARAPGEIRRVNVNIAPLTLDEFRQLKARQIGTYQLFQETYHRETYAKRPPRRHEARLRLARERPWTGRWRRASTTSGIGVLFGLFDWRFEILALVQHIRHLERAVRRRAAHDQRAAHRAGDRVRHREPPAARGLRHRLPQDRGDPASGGAVHRDHHVHRETADIRRETFALGVSQISAGSRTNPGGYSEDERDRCGAVLPRRPPLARRGGARRRVARLRAVVLHRLLPARAHRRDFMDLAKPGEIKEHCGPNALSTFQEYLVDYGSPETRAGRRSGASRDALAELEPGLRAKAEKMVRLVKDGTRDVYC